MSLTDIGVSTAVSTLNTGGRVLGRLGMTIPDLSPSALTRAAQARAGLTSFGDWGFVLAHPHPLRPDLADLPNGLAFLDANLWQGMQRFPVDTGAVPVEVNTIITHALVSYYEDGWTRWFGR